MSPILLTTAIIATLTLPLRQSEKYHKPSPTPHLSSSLDSHFPAQLETERYHEPSPTYHLLSSRYSHFIGALQDGRAELQASLRV